MNRLLSGWLPELGKGLQPVPSLVLELLIVILAWLVVFAVFHMLPLFLFFSFDAFSPLQFCIGLVVCVILNLFLYFFVEPERHRKRLQEELLRSAQLQKESYKAQLQQLEDQLDEHVFFKANRQLLIHIDAVVEVHPYFKGRLLLRLEPLVDQNPVVNSNKTANLKAWLDS